MKVSVALCTYNGEKFLEEQFKSYLDQTHLPYEIVICDDGSSDQTIEIIETLRKKTNIPVRLYRNETRLGFLKNFEKAILLCTGDLIALSDQDDVWLPEKLKVLTEDFGADKNKKIDMIFTDLKLVDADLKPLGRTMWEEMDFTNKLRNYCVANGFLQVFKNMNYATGASVIIRKEFVKDFTPLLETAELWFHDGQMALIAAAKNSLMFNEKSLVLYRQHSGQSIGLKFGNLPKILSVILQHVLLKRKSDLIFFEKINVFSPGEKERLVKEIKHLENRIIILKKPFLKRIIPVSIEMLRINYWRFYKKSFLRVALSDFLNN